nr:MarR family transcriptional regulator [Sulfobacillus harzensis]
MRIAHDTDLTPWDVTTLLILEGTGPLQPTQLAQVTGFPTGQMTKILDRLEASKLTRRTKHPTDRRRQIIVIRPAGRRAVARWLSQIATGTRPGRGGGVEVPSDLPDPTRVSARWNALVTPENERT